eukprot:CAMPEP_0113943946 /NCGR_PEP_ID=MMETSP1339-20121228/29829_1 /TAXON_ID=94617 /ORGANISM="Fibrocapsa japonica" /LENGTH=118 /DNA_ID=CAMNT_0000948963 /DNA_START=95 /DNA_END=451 /DNA_ORIENTATION=+ /assembly_acc=CAM_ASM_000762
MEEEQPRKPPERIVSQQRKQVGDIKVNMRIHVHIWDKVISINCGQGNQKIRWLGHAGISRWDEESCEGWKYLGIPTIVTKTATGEEPATQLQMNDFINEALQDGDHVEVMTSMDPPSG